MALSQATIEHEREGLEPVAQYLRCSHTQGDLIAIPCWMKVLGNQIHAFPGRGRSVQSPAVLSSRIMTAEIIPDATSIELASDSNYTDNRAAYLERKWQRVSKEFKKTSTNIAHDICRC